MLVTTKEMLLDAQKNHYAVGAFNVENLEFVMAVLAAAEETKSPVIMQTTSGTIKKTGLDYFYGMVKAAAERASVPVALHLDHGDGYDRCMKALRTGYTSVMIDGSALPFEENIAKTAEVVNYCHMVGVSVEGELGTIGDTGTSIEGGMTEVIYTNPEDAKKFVEQTGVDTLAVAIGTCHGLYPKGVTPKLRMDVLEEITKVVDIPLVLHGGSGNPDSEIAEAVRLGIQKVNISSDYKSAFFTKAREILSQEGSGWDPNNLFPECIEAGKAVIKQKMELFNCVGAAKYYRDPVMPQWRQELN